MAKLSFKVTGVAQYKNSLRQYAKAVQQAANEALKQGAENIASNARANCRVPSIASTINMGKSANGYEVTTQGVQSAYLEFGTGNFAAATTSNMPKDWKDMAMEFYINGLGRSPAQPYLYPAYTRERAVIETEIKNKIEAI